MNIYGCLTVGLVSSNRSASARHKLGIDKNDGVLQMNFNENKNELVISKAISINELSEKLMGYIKPG